MTPAFESELSRDASAPGVARRLLAGWFASMIGADTLAKCKLLVSELVTNAVRHGQGRITLRADLSQDRMHVEVIDEGPGFEHQVRRRDFERMGVGGWGLSIVDAVSARWGVWEGTTGVWFELRLPGPSPRPGDEPGGTRGR